MLVLSRKANEGIVVDGPCRIVVVEIRGDKVRLGFVAPDSTKILRDEVADAIARHGRTGPPLERRVSNDFHDEVTEAIERKVSSDKS